MTSINSCVCGQCVSFLHCEDNVAAGYRAQAQGKSMADNPHDSATHSNAHWDWRKGFIEAFNDSH